MHNQTNKHKHHKWALDIGQSLKKESRLELHSPPGYVIETRVSAISNESQNDNEGHVNVVDKRSWDTALGPIKSLPMNVFIMYMAGNTISIFPIMMVGMMFFRPIQAFMGLRATTNILSLSDQWFLQTFVYIVGNLLALALAVFKCNSMGLLPTHASDWLAFAEPLFRVEFAGGGISL